MKRASLSELFSAKSIAVVGVSADLTRIGGRPIPILQAGGFKGQIYPVNPKYTEVHGLPCFPGIGDIPGKVDLVICAAPANAVEAVLADCVAKGVAGVVVFAGGFAETGDEGAQAQKHLSQLAASSGTRIIGPNCLGFAGFDTGVIASFHPVFAKPMPAGRLGLISQSGAFASMAALMAIERGIGFSHVIATGNEADVDVAECLSFLAEDEGTDVILLYLEGVRNGKALLKALATAQARRKPVVVVKVGRTEVGAHAAESHTAVLAGADAVYDAVFRQFGVYRARSIEEFYDVGAALAIGGRPKSRRTALVTVSGGVGVLMADSATDSGLDVAQIPDEVKRRFKKLVPIAGVDNPLDVTGMVTNNPELLNTALRLVLDECSFDAVIGFQGGLLVEEGNCEANLAMWSSLKEAYPDRMLCVSGPAPEAYRRRFEAAKLPFFVEPTHATRAVAAAAAIAEAFDRTPGWDPQENSPAKPLPARQWTEPDTLAVLSEAGIPCIPNRLVTNRDEAEKAATSLGFPVALKVVSPEIIHKTEVGGVRLGLGSAAEVRAAFDDIMRNIAGHGLGASVQGCIIAPMLSGGVETILGIQNDPVFGPVIMFGLGGVFVEVLHSVSFRVAPFGIDEAHRMIREIAGTRVLEGVRGAAASDTEALALALVALSRFAWRHADDISSVDINPFIVLPEGQGAFAVDAVFLPKER